MIIALCIDKLLPAAQYGGVPGTTEQEYNSLRWEDQRTKPTWKAIQDAWILVQKDIEIENLKRQLQETDNKMIRKIDELYTVLISKGVLNKKDFSTYYRDAVEEREILRSGL